MLIYKCAHKHGRFCCKCPKLIDNPQVWHCLQPTSCDSLDGKEDVRMENVYRSSSSKKFYEKITASMPLSFFPALHLLSQFYLSACFLSLSLLQVSSKGQGAPAAGRIASKPGIVFRRCAVADIP